MLIFLFSIFYSTKTYHDENQTLVTSFEFDNSKKALSNENIFNKDTPTHFLGKKNRQINIKKIKTCKYIIIDSITINVGELIIDSADQFPFKIVNGGKISIQNTLSISSQLNEKVYIPQEINDPNTMEISNADCVINSLNSTSKSYILHNANLFFEGNSFFANTISGDEKSTINLQKASSLTVEVVEGNLTIICSDNQKTNLYISKPSNFSHLIISNETDFFAINCTIGEMTVFPSNENSELIELNLFDSHLNINKANLSNCLILSENSRLGSPDLNLKNLLFSDYNFLIENPDITINDINYQGNATFKGKFILSLTGNVKQSANSLIILADTSNLIASDDIFILINSASIEANNIQYNYSNLIILQSQEKNLKLNNLNSFSLIDLSADSSAFDIQINNENQFPLHPDSKFLISLICNQNPIDLKIDNINASKIDFFTNLESNGLSITASSSIKSAIEMEIIKATQVEIKELNNIFEFYYNASEVTVPVTFNSIKFDIDESDNDTFYLSYTLPSDATNAGLEIKDVDKFSTVLVHDVNLFPTFTGSNAVSVELDNCNDIQLGGSMNSQIKTAKQSNIQISSDIIFTNTIFHDCNLSSSTFTITFKGDGEFGNDASVINNLECDKFIVDNYRPLFIDKIVESTANAGCTITCTKTQLHINSNASNLICTINDDSYIYVDEIGESTYKIDGSGKFILKNANEINDKLLSITGFTGSLFIYNCQNISSIPKNAFKDLLILSSQFTISESITNIGFYNSTIFISEPGISIDQLVVYNSIIRSTDNITVTDDKYATLSIKNLIFNGDIIVRNLNLQIVQSINSMNNFYKEYTINQTVFTDNFNQSTHSKITMIPSDDTRITFGAENGNNDQFSFGDNHEHSLFSFHGNSIMTNEGMNFLNFNYFFSNINFTNDDNKIKGNIETSEYPSINFEVNKTTIKCPSNQKVIILQEIEKEDLNYSIFEVACSSSDNYDDSNDEYFSSKNCTSDEYSTLVCMTENEDEIESTKPRFTISNAFFNSVNDTKCIFDSVIVSINNFNDAKLSLNVYNNSEVTFYDKHEATLRYLNMENCSKVNIYRNIIDNTTLSMSKNSNLTILDSYAEYYLNPLVKSNTTGYLHQVLMSESSMHSNFMFNITTSSFTASSSSFTNAKILIQKSLNNKQEEEDEEDGEDAAAAEQDEHCLLENTLTLNNTYINISKDIEKVQFTDFEYNGNSNSSIIINGNATFSGVVHVNGIINCPNKATVLDFSKADSSKSIILYDLHINCTVNFTGIDESNKLHLGGTNSLINEGTTFIPPNLSVFVEGRIHFHNFNLIDSIAYSPDYVDTINETFINSYHGRPEIIFHNYPDHQVDFNISGQANITVLDDNITFTKSFETFNDSVISFVNLIVFKEGATFNGHHVIEGTSNPAKLLMDFDHVLLTDQTFVFNDFSCKGKTKVTIQSENITIKDNHVENDTILLESIQANLMKIEQLFNLSSFFKQETDTNDNGNSNDNNDSNDDNESNDNSNDGAGKDKEEVDNTVYEWENINIVSTSYFRINLFNQRSIYFHYNDIVFRNTSVELYGGFIKDVFTLNATDSTFDIKDDYIESETCSFTNAVFTNFMSSIGCHRLTTKNAQFNGYVDMYYPNEIDMANTTVNLSLSNNYPLFNVHNVIIQNDEIEYTRKSKKMKALNGAAPARDDVTLLDVENEIFDLKIRAELNTNLDDESHETAKLFMFDVMPNSLPVITTTQTKGDKTEYLFNSEIVNNRIITFKSLKCSNNGEYDPTTGECNQCVNGSYSYEDKCYESQVGQFINTGMKLNRKCPFGYYSDKPGQSECTKCPNHMTTLKEGSTSKSDCVCEVDYMFDDSFSTDDNEKCVKCPEGLACSTPNTLITNVKILENYYYYNKEYDTNDDKNEFNITDEDLTHHLNSSYIFKCLSNGVCLNPVQSQQRLTQCKDEYNGFLCAKCKKNYFHKSISKCRKCSKFPIAALIFGPIIHAFLIWFCFFHDDRYSVFFYFFMLFTQQYMNIYGINIDWPAIFSYVSIIFESINLDFRRFFDCETNDEVWIQGIVFMIINCAYTAAFITFFIFDIQSYRKKKIKKKEESSSSSDCMDCNCRFGCHNDNDNKDTDIEKTQTKVVQILTIYYFMTFLTQLRWLLSSMASQDGHLIVYPYVILKSKDYTDHVVIILVNSIYFFGFLLFFVLIFCYIMIYRPVTVMLSMFKYTLFEVKYCFIFLPFVYVVKSLLMVFFVIYLNHNWYVNIYLIVVLILCLEVLLYSKPFINDYIRKLEVINTIFEIFIVTMGIMAQQTHSSFEIFSIVLMAIILVIFILIYIFLIYKYHAGFKQTEKDKEDYNNKDDTNTTSKKEVLIKYKNEFNQFFFYDEKFNLNIIMEWFFNLNFIFKAYVFRVLKKIKNIPEIKDYLDSIKDDVDENFNEYQELFTSFYESRDSRSKEEIQNLLKMLNSIDLDKNGIKRAYDNFIISTRTKSKAKNKKQPDELDIEENYLLDSESQCC